MKEEFLRERAYAVIQSKLLEGELRAGDVVSEQALAADIGMSRTPVREAIGQLEREGLFVKVPRVGTRVRLPTPEELRDLYEVREALEGFAAARVAQALAEADLDTMERWLEEGRRIAAEARSRGLQVLDEALLSRFFQADIGFHSVMVDAWANARALQIVSEFRVIQRVFEYDRMAHTARVVEDAADQHAQVLDALRRRDSEAASAAMAAHIAAARETALASLAPNASASGAPE